MDVESYLRTINSANFKKQKIEEKYTSVIKYLFDNKFGSFSEIDVKFIINYIVKEILLNAKIDDGLTIKMLKKGQYDEKLGNSNGVCIFIPTILENVQTVIYSYGVIEKMMSNNYNMIISGLCTVFHELDHFCQNTAIKQDVLFYQIYLMVLETLVREADENFYKLNYGHLLKETHAQKHGLKFSLEFLKHFRKDVYDMYPQDKVKKVYKDCNDNFFKSQLTILEETGDSIKQLDKIAATFILNNPNIIKIFPILKVAYNEDGTKKDLRTLLFEREVIINNEQQMLSEGTNEREINALYKIIINEKYFDVDSELDIITDYIRDTKRMDSFICYLLKYRLNMKNFSNEKQDLLINSIKDYIGENSKSNVK